MIIEALKPEEHFHDIRAWLDKTIENSGGYVSIGVIFEYLRSGTWKLFLIYTEDTLVGFGIAEAMPTANGAWLNLPYVYSNDSLYLEFLGHMSKIAYEEGMTGVKFISGRKGFEKIAEKYKWKKGFTEYIVRDFRE